MNTSRQPWHATPIAGVFDALHAAPAGLTNADASARLAQYGPNALVAEQPTSAVRILIAQLRSIIVVLLLGLVWLWIKGGLEWGPSAEGRNSVYRKR